MEDLDDAIINFYMGLTLGKIESIFHKKLQHRHWVIYYPFEFVFHIEFVFHKQYYQNALTHLLIPYLGQFDDSPDSRYVRSFYTKYLYLIDIGDECGASDLLKTTIVPELTIEEGYELFLRLAQIPVNKIFGE